MWELFNLMEDRTELHNRINDFPDLAGELHRDWLAWAERCDVQVTDIHKRL